MATSSRAIDVSLITMMSTWRLASQHRQTGRPSCCSFHKATVELRPYPFLLLGGGRAWRPMGSEGIIDGRGSLFGLTPEQSSAIGGPVAGCKVALRLKRLAPVLRSRSFWASALTKG